MSLECVNEAAVVLPAVQCIGGWDGGRGGKLLKPEIIDVTYKNKIKTEIFSSIYERRRARLCTPDFHKRKVGFHQVIHFEGLSSKR